MAEFTINIPDNLMDGLDYAISKEKEKEGVEYDRRSYVEFVMTKACENYSHQKEQGI